MTLLKLEINKLLTNIDDCSLPFVTNFQILTKFTHKHLRFAHI